MSTSNANNKITMVIDDDFKKKIESTQFVFMVAMSGVGKSFNGDYLEAIRGWKHVDGDIPLKNANTSPEYREMVDQFIATFSDDGHKDGWKAYISELARLTLEAAKDSNKVVLTHASYFAPMRIFLCQQLIDAGAKDVTMVYLHCDEDAHLEAVWKRYYRLAEQVDSTVEEFLKGWGIEGIVDFDAFRNYFKGKHYALFEELQEYEKPFKVVDVTAKDVTVMDRIDKAVSIQDENRGDLSYEEMVEKIKKIDVQRDQEWMDREAKSSEEKDVAEKEPE